LEIVHFFVVVNLISKELFEWLLIHTGDFNEAQDMQYENTPITAVLAKKNTSKVLPKAYYRDC